MTTAQKDECRISYETDGSKLTIILDGQISTANASNVENEVKEHLDGAESIVIDAKELTYISSAGLRILLRLKKAHDDITVINVTPEVYDIFEVTGFTEMLNIRRAFRHLSVEGCEVIGEGANGIVYRYDEDTIVKVFRNPDSLAEIERERELARTAFVLGVPTAISYDIVQVDNGLYGSVFELLNAKSYHRLLKEGTKTVDEIAQMSAELLKIVHATEPKPGALPSRKQISTRRMVKIKEAGIMPEEEFERLNTMVNAIPDETHMLHGDFHIKNVMIQNEESLLIDMDTLCVGNTVYELAGMYLPYIGFAKIDPEDTVKFFGLSPEMTEDLYNRIMTYYFADRPEELENAKKKAIVLACARMMYYCAVMKHVNENNRDAIIAMCRENFNKLLPELSELAI